MTGLPAWVSDVDDAWGLVDSRPMSGDLSLVTGLEDAGVFTVSSALAPPASKPILVSSSVTSAMPLPPTGRWAQEMDRRGFAWTEGSDKFTLGPNKLWLPWPEGTEYLSLVPPYALARVTALRKRVGELGGAPAVIIGPLAESSATALYKAAQDLWSQCQDKSQWPALAKRLGVPVDRMATVAGDVEAAVNNATTKYLRISVSSLFADLRALLGSTGEKLVESVLANVQDAAIKLAKSGARAIGVTDSMLGALAEGLQVIMPFAKAAWEGYLADQAERDARFATLYRDYMEAWVMRPFRFLADRSLPLPWHVPDVYSLVGPKPSGVEKWVATPDMEGASWAYSWACASLLALPVASSAAVRVWWATTTAWLGDPLVKDTMVAMGRTRGLVACDELVAAVGVPMAVANGIDPWEFTRMLWGYARGWRAEPGAWTRTEYHPTGLTNVYDTKGQLMLFSGYPDAAGNAWALQLAQLARVALELVDAHARATGAVMRAGALASPLSPRPSGGGGGAAVAAAGGLALLFLL